MPKQTVVDLDCLSTYLEWLGSREVEVLLQDKVFELAGLCVGVGIQNCEEFREYTDHSLWLMLLTEALLLLHDRNVDRRDIRVILFRVSLYAGGVLEPDQRARVYAKLALVYRKLGHYVTAAYWAKRCLLTRGAVLRSRAKGFFGASACFRSVFHPCFIRGS